MHKRIVKIVSSVVGALMCVAALAGCGAAAAAEPLDAVTQLPSSGVITKDQLKTLQGKTGTYSFVGHKDGITYTWYYDAAQVKNPEDQHLKVDFAASGSDVDAVKKTADKAPYALSVKLSKFQLAGSPQLVIDLPQKWTANKVKVVTTQDGELRQVSAARPTIGVSSTMTELTSTVTVTNKTLYFVCGLDKNAPIPGITKRNSKEVKSKKGATSKDAGDSQDSASGDSDSDSGASASSGESSGNGSGSSSSVSSGDKKSSSSQSGSAGTSSGSTGSSSKKNKDPNSVSVTVSVDAKTAAANLNQITAKKRAYVPSSGWIIAPTKITLKKGETAYDALAKATKSRGIQMESKWFPVYNAYYVEGINNLYEFDGGSASGWMYSVNGWFPNYGSSQYSSLEDGSTIAWRYTLELGNDVGGGF